MMRHVVIGLWSGLAFLAAAPAVAETRDYPLSGFEKVQLDAAADVTITTGDRFAVHADGSPELVGQLAPAVRNGTLFLDWHKPAPHITEGHLAIAVTLPRATGVGIRGAGRVTLDRAEGPTVVAAIDGTGAITIATVRTPRMVVAMHGTGAITVSGTTDWIDARKSGVGSIDAGGLTARGGVLIASGVGSISARVDGPVDATLSGIGSIDVAGHPTCTIHRSGLGHVSCGD
jgi:hypothetical protein